VCGTEKYSCARNSRNIEATQENTAKQNAFKNHVKSAGIKLPTSVKTKIFLESRTTLKSKDINL
jgi:hypothetical protein